MAYVNGVVVPNIASCVLLGSSFFRRVSKLFSVFCTLYLFVV